MDNGPATVRAFLAEQRMSQRQLASAARVSQPTVSRALSSPGIRRGAARDKLFSYIQQRRTKLPLKATEAFRTVWDGTEEHDDALSDLILASQRLRSLGTKE